MDRHIPRARDAGRMRSFMEQPSTRRGVRPAARRAKDGRPAPVMRELKEKARAGGCGHLSAHGDWARTVNLETAAAEMPAARSSGPSVQLLAPDTGPGLLASSAPPAAGRWCAPAARVPDQLVLARTNRKCQLRSAQPADQDHPEGTLRRRRPEVVHVAPRSGLRYDRLMGVRPAAPPTGSRACWYRASPRVTVLRELPRLGYYDGRARRGAVRGGRVPATTLAGREASRGQGRLGPGGCIPMRAVASTAASRADVPACPAREAFGGRGRPV